MAMVGSSPASQSTSRPSWSAPQSSTPPEADEAGSQQQRTATSAANHHGAIGEHRRSSRSSSVSSGGSSGGNGTEALDSTRHQTQSRLASLSQSQSTAGQESAFEQHAKQILQHLDMQSVSGDESHEAQALADMKKDKLSPADMQSGMGLKPEGCTSDTELVSQLNLLSNTCNTSPTNSVQLGHLVDGQRPSDQSFQRPMTGTSGQGRTVTGNPAPGPFNPASPLDMTDVVGGFVQSFTTGIQNDFDMMGFPKYMNKFSQNSSSNIPSSNADMGPIGGGFHSATSPRAFQNTGNSFGGPGTAGTSQSFMNSGNSSHFPPMSSNMFGRNQAMGTGQTMSTNPAMNAPNRGNGFYSGQSNFSSGSGGFFPNQGQSSNYFSSQQLTPFQGFAAQDFSLPPPSHSWGSGPFSPNMSDPLVERVMCRGCQKAFKWPTTLECMHVFCFNCVCSKVSASTQSVSCPFCNRMSSVAHGVYKLLLDFALCRYMIKMKMSPFACTGCTRDMDAVICCISCPAYLCAECHEGHRSMRIFSSHVLTPITKVVKYNGEFEPMCDKHIGEPLTKYCVTCAVMICEKCHTDHAHPDMPSNHNNHDLQEAYNIVIARLRNWNEDACIKHKEVVELKKKIPEMKNDIDSKKRIARRNVDEYTDYCKNVMEQNRGISHEMIERAAEQMESALAKFNKMIDEIESELEAVASFNTFNLDEGTPSMVMTSLNNMESSYKRAVGEYSEICLKNNGDGITFEFTFNPDYPRTNEFIQENFSTVTYKINDTEFNVVPMSLRTDLSRARSFTDYSSADNPDCNYQRWSAAPDSMSISTWNSGSDRDRKGTFIPYLNRCRTRTSFVHVFGDYGRGEYAFTEPSGQAYFEDGSYVICDTNNHRIVYYSKDHEYIRSIGQPPNLPPLAEDHEPGKGGPRGKGFTRQDGYLYFPNRVAICPVTKHIVATERPPSHDVQIFTIDGEFVSCFGGSVLQHPRGVTVDENGVIIVVECKVMKLTMFDHDGTQLASHSLAKDLEFPNDVAAKDGKIYISDNRGHCVQVFDYDAKFLQKIGNDSITYFPIGVSINYLNQVVVTDNHNTFNITVFDLEGRVLNIFESITKHAQCHNVAVHPTKLELMLTTKDCNVYFFNYDPNSQHPPLAPTSRGSNHFLLTRRSRGSGNGNHSNSTYY